MEEFYYYYSHHALQKRANQLIGSWEEDTIFIRLKFFKSTVWHGVRTETKIAQRDFGVKFSHIKHQLANNYGSDRWYEALISEYLKSMGVPQDEHSAIVHTTFRVIEAAPTPVDAVVVGIWDNTIFDADDGDESCRQIPASRSSIQGLVQVTLGTSDTWTPSCCVICLEDFQEQEENATRLPCRHNFHLHCIVQCLEISHLCPLCRYPLPTQED